MSLHLSFPSWPPRLGFGIEMDFGAMDVPEHPGPTLIQSMFSWSQAWPRAHIPCRGSAQLASSFRPPLARLSPGPCLDLAGL